MKRFLKAVLQWLRHTFICDHLISVSFDVEQYYDAKSDCLITNGVINCHNCGHRTVLNRSVLNRNKIPAKRPPPSPPPPPKKYLFP